MFNTQTGTLSLASNAAFGADITCPNIPRNSSETTSLVIFDSVSNRIMRAPVTLANTRITDERFSYLETKHNSVIVETLINPILNPLIDFIEQFIALPIENNTVATLLGDFVWRIRANNTDELYCLATNNRGCYRYVPGSASNRNFIMIDLCEGAVDYQLEPTSLLQMDQELLRFLLAALFLVEVTGIFNINKAVNLQDRQLV